MRILAVLAFSILYLSTSVEATVEITEARLAGESDAKNLDKWEIQAVRRGLLRKCYSDIATISSCSR